MDVDNNNMLIVGNPEGILDQKLSLHPIHLLNIILNLLVLYY
jgi:hypothetical protein